jgi:hypothetical protein
MKKLKIVFFVLIFFSPFFFVFGQKVGYNSNFVTIDKVDWLKFKDGIADDSDFNLVNDSDVSLILIQFLKVVSVDLQSETNPEGIVYYTKVKFVPLNKEFEIQKDKEAVLSLLYKENVITKEKVLDTSVVDALMKNHTQIFTIK